MTDGLDMSAGDILVTAGGVVKFSAAKPMFRRVPQGLINLTSYSITFPSFLNGTSWYHYFTTTDPLFHHTQEYCSTEGRLAAQDWGPDQAAPYNLPDIDLGAAPLGCDYLDVQLNLTRTVSPHLTGQAGAFGADASVPIYLSFPWPLEIIEGQWMNPDDAAIAVEAQPGMTRMFWFEIVSGRVLLRRKQSIGTDGLNAGWGTHFIDHRNNDATASGYQLRQTDAGACIATNLMDSTSVYTGSIQITPCITS